MANHPKSVGTCQIEELLGKGGMAEVFRGRQDGLERPVAVKAILPELKSDAEALERFRREALALAALQHENIVAVHELEEKSGRLYLIMELVDGVDLASLLGHGPLPVDVALVVGVALAQALGHAHFRRVVHRDVKPSNVMLSRQGVVKLTDFGIAKDLALDDLTRRGLVVGTLQYLAPEQVLGQRADPRSDLYSLGVLLYEVLSGQRPYRAPEQAELLRAIVQGRRRPLREVAPRVPRALAMVIERCLELEPGRRYQRASELARDLGRLLGAVLEGSPSARLVAFLRERGALGEEALTLLASEELEASRAVARPETVLAASQFEPGWSPGRRRGRILRPVLWTLVALALLSLAAVAAVRLWPGPAAGALRAVADQLEAPRS
ncbi:MAG TPA: serine/threonine-protein kinase [Myxococcota bacterium]|nr:serine/threonine-protein kinase [Myxococcota bacterium]HRY95526.1 serine/threonine-protein kinase [Myxococcota bacterium]HSA19928.1 serine/threonine-protein kinase [Myxococcota bacterium]